MNLDTQLKRVAYGSPLATTLGKLALAAILVALFLLCLPGFKEYYTVYPLQLIVGSLMATVLYLPTLIALWYFDRREREPWQLALLAVLSVTLFFAPVTSHVLGLVDKLIPVAWVVGFVEEFWKVAPLLLLVIFLPRAVNGTRDGLIYGALGGFGFAILEYAANTTWEYFPDKGWAAFVEGVSRFNLLGTHNHIIWAAAIGAAIGWAVTQRTGWKRYVVPVAVYLAVAAVHILEDKGGNIATTMIAGAALQPLAMAQPNPEQFLQAIFVPSQIYFGTVNLLLINIIILPVLFVVLRRSGDTERRVIREQLADEGEGVITRPEYEGVVADRRLRTRRIAGLPKSAGKRIVQLQDELAFHKAFVTRRSGAPDSDTPVVALRTLIEAERAGTPDAAQTA
jgi:RsiW-degrading membrane proteinase PrsW (M82 family)